jgi:hypothetical protein
MFVIGTLKDMADVKKGSVLHPTDVERYLEHLQVPV